MPDEHRNGTSKINALLVGLLSVGVAILMAGIPWAYTVHGRLTEIETLLRYRTKEHELINEMDKRLIHVELVVKGLERGGPPGG